MKTRNALRSYGVTLTMLLCMIGFILLHLGHRGFAFSEEESRVLQQHPAAGMVAVFHGSFQKESEAWPRDQFNQRFTLVQLHANLNYILGKRELQDVITGQDGILFQKQGKPNQERLQTKAGRLRLFAKQHGDKRLSVLLIPNKSAIRRKKLPMYGQKEDQLRTLKDFHKKLPAAITWIDVTAPLWRRRGEVLHCTSDYHWTTRGAAAASDTWYAAEKKKRKTGYEVYTVNDQFHGILTDASGYHRGKEDHVDIYVPRRSQEFVITYVQEQRRTATIFEQDEAASANPYDVFFSGNHGLIQLDTAQSGKWLLVIKDSYVSCLLPFLIPYYKDITVVDPRYYYSDLDKLIEGQGTQEALFLYNANTFFNDDSLGEILKKEVK